MFEIFAKRDESAKSELVDKVEMPKTATDLVAWRELIVAENDTQLLKKVSNLAFMNYVIKRQGRFRTGSAKGITGRWKYGEKTTVVKVQKVTMSRELIEKLGYTEEQIAAMVAEGVEIV